VRDRKTVAEMSGELLREAAMLILVFAPLDTIFAEAGQLTWAALAGIIVFGVAVFVAGAVIERKRE